MPKSYTIMIDMKQEQPFESFSLRVCEQCQTFFTASPNQKECVCQKCCPESVGTPKFTEEQHIEVSGLDLEEVSPKELVSKLKKTTSMHFIEGTSIDMHTHDQEMAHLSKVTNVDSPAEDSDESLEEHERHAKDTLEQDIRKKQLEMKADKKIIIGSGFTFDMTDFFTFKRKKELASGEGTFFDEISGGPLSWIILLYTVTSSAMIPGWIMNIGATKFVRKVWRFTMQAAFMVPFVMYEKRTATPEVKEKYTLAYITNRKNIVKPYISSLSASLWFLFILSSFEWTFVSHGIVLGSLSNFFLSISRAFRKQTHHIESGGQILVTIGVIFALQDTVFLNGSQESTADLDVLNTFYLSRTWWERLAGDVVAILTSLMMSQFSKFTSDLRNYYPPFLSMLLVNLFNVFHMSLIAFFFNGGTFSTQAFWGMFSIFADQHFTSFMYMAIVLAIGQLVSVVLVTRMFPDPIIPALALTLEPFMASLIVQLASIQNLPGDFSMMGYLFIFPGMLIILMGQCFFQRQKSYTEESDKRVKHLLEEIKELKKISESREIRAMDKEKKKVLKSRTMYQSLVIPPFTH